MRLRLSQASKSGPLVRAVASTNDLAELNDHFDTSGCREISENLRRIGRLRASPAPPFTTAALAAEKPHQPTCQRATQPPKGQREPEECPSAKPIEGEDTCSGMHRPIGVLCRLPWSIAGCNRTFQCGRGGKLALENSDHAALNVIPVLLVTTP